MIRVGNYNLDDDHPLGQGGMGCVYLGYDRRQPESRTPLAVKMLNNRFTAYPEYRNLFLGEAATMQQLDHPSVVHITGAPFRDGQGNLYLPMEYIEGQTITQYVMSHQSGCINEREAYQLMCMILDAFIYIHESAGKIHRDIKPSNIMVRPNGSICIIDFGIAKDAKIGATGNTVGQVIGTDGYMSPEQASGLNIDHRTDIYSLGCLLYFMLTGRHAIEKKSNDYSTRMAILNDKVAAPSTIMSGLSSMADRIVARAMDKDMTRRYQTARDFKQALNGQAPPQPSPDDKSITVGRDNCDIIISNVNVSRHHLTVSFSKQSQTITITDKSSNGTAVNGKRIHHESYSFKYDPTLSVTQAFPEVLLCGFEDCGVDWSEVLDRLRLIPGGYPPPPPPPPPAKKSKNWIAWVFAIAAIGIAAILLAI